MCLNWLDLDCIQLLLFLVGCSFSGDEALFLFWIQFAWVDRRREDYSLHSLFVLGGGETKRDWKGGEGVNERERET